MISYRFVPISSQKGVLFFETPGIYVNMGLFLPAGAKALPKRFEK